MIDYDDADDVAFMGMFSEGGVAIILIIAAIIFYMMASSNDTECQKKSCPVTMSPKLMKHECLCVVEAK